MTIESCTGGAIANTITDVSGSENVFLGGVRVEVLTYGQVYSKKVVLAMVEIIQKRSGADIIFSTTGVMENMDMRPYHDGTEP